MKLLVSGCSVTHGAETHNGFMSNENIKQSFSAHLASYLNLDLINVALSGGSNEYIFHSIIDSIQQYVDIKQVLVVWTGHNRLYWKSNDRHYFIIPNWASSMIDLENFVVSHDKQHSNVWITGDSANIVETLTTAHKFFVEHYFDSSELLKKTAHYDMCLKQLCLSKNISYNSLHVTEIYNFLKTSPRHPTINEHKDVAKFLIQEFYS